MISPSIPFVVPDEFLGAIARGDIVRQGTLLKDVSTGRILAHVQETGALRSGLELTGGINPFNAVDGIASMFGVIQNEQIKGMLRGLEVLQIATLASTFVGIGVTVASNVVILRQLMKMEERLRLIEQSIEQLPNEIVEIWENSKLRDLLLGILTPLERWAEVPLRSDQQELIVMSAEENLHRGFNQIYSAVEDIARFGSTVDAHLLHCLLCGLALCGNGQINALLWLNDMEVARIRAKTQFEKLQQLAWLIPRDRLIRKMKFHFDDAKIISGDASEMRMRVLSLHSLTDQLIQRKIDGRQYLEYVESESRHPILIFPFESAIPARRVAAAG